MFVIIDKIDDGTNCGIPIISKFDENKEEVIK